MRLKQLLKSKRGIALENAIIFMIVIFSLCALLTSLTLLGHYQVKLENLTLLNDVKIDQIGEDYLESFRSESLFDTGAYEDYECILGENFRTLTVLYGDDEYKTAVLYIELAANGDVVTWRYSTPTS